MISMRPLKMFLLIGACIVVGVSGCSRDNHDHPDLTTGEQLFNHHCAACHGEDGTGRLFDGLPANILTQKSPSEIMSYIITLAHHERQMPLFTSMPPVEAQLITQHLIQLQTLYKKGKINKPKQFLIEP